MSSKKQDKNTNNNLNNTLDVNELSNEEKESLIKQINILNISENTIYIFIIAILMNLNYVIWNRSTLLDQLNNTTSSAEDIDLTKIPRITNIMFLYGGAIFLLINFSGFQDVSSLPESTYRERCKAWKAFISSLLVFLAAGITSGNLEV